MNQVVYTSTFNIELIVLALIIAFFSAYIALLFAKEQSMNFKKGGFLISALVMGLGIWAMHYVAMLGYDTSMPIRYDLGLILLSLFVPVMTSFLAFKTIEKTRQRKISSIVGGIINGIGIASMHFIGMEAMKMHGTIVYNWQLVSLAILLAMILSIFSFAIYDRSKQNSKSWQLNIAALLMGFAMTGLHFTAMKALNIMHHHKIDTSTLVQDVIVNPTTLATMIGVATLAILFIIMVKAFNERNQAIMQQLESERKLRQAEMEYQKTLRKQQEQQKEDNELYRAILASMLEGIIVFDLEGNIITANRTASKMFGVELSYLLQTKLSDKLNFIKEDGSILPFDEYQVKRALEENRAINGSVVGYDKGSGSIQWLLMNVEPLYASKNREMEGVVCTFTDITEQKKASQKLLENNSLLRTLLENLNFGVVVTDKEDKVIISNQIYSDILKIDGNPNDLVGVSIQGLISKIENLLTNINAFGTRVNEILDNKEPARDELYFTDGRIIERHYAPFYFEEQYIGNLWILKDITNQKNLEKHLINSSEEAIKANRSKSEFLSKMSHELRTPLNGIFGFAQLLELDESLTDEQKENVAEILKAGRYLLSLINDVLDLARVEAGSLKIVHSHVDVDKILNESMKMIMPMAQQKKIRVIQKREVSSKVFMEGDPVRLKQIFINLLENAIKYNTNGGKVIVEVETSGEHVTVSIKDTGYGIDESEFDNVFMPFFRSKLISQQVSGTGIGLPLAKQLVESMGGAITFDSQIGIGSTFTVLFPLISNNDLHPKNNDRLTEVKSYGDKAYQLLYIEDHESNRTILKKYFDAIPNMTVSCVDFGYAGIQLAKQYHFDLILLDLNLPDIHGFEVFKKLRQDNDTKDIPVVAVSANAIQKNISEAIALGFADYITKPFDFSKLHDVISEILDLR